MNPVEPSPDLIVVGAGIFGLWAARHALKRGARVRVIEKRRVGAGASGGFLGSLMPHMPDRWNAKKQMQYEALYSIGGAIAALEADTGLKCGFRRCGRLLPLKHGRMPAHLAARIEGARAHWVDETGAALFTMEHVAPEELAKRFRGPGGGVWLSPGAAPFGAQFDTLSARVDPRAYLTALAAYVGNHPKGEIRQGIGVVDATADGAGVSVTLGDGARLHAGRAVIANGWEAYDLLARMGGGRGVAVGGRRVTGRGVKGQAVLIDIAHDDDLPILYDSGSYVVPQGAGMGADATGRASRIAVGSTSTDAWLDDGVAMDGSALEAARTGCDPADTGFLDHAVTFCPALSGAPIAESWANIRPRNTIADAITGKIGTEPATGPVDGTDRIRLAVGGFKIGFGIAHLSGAHAIGL